jgi:hypothetical protein
MDHLVKTCREELGAIVVKIDITDCFGVPHVCSKALFVGEYVPDFAGAIVRS